jgi:hypothetical protein
MKSPVLRRKDYPFSGSDAGGRRAAGMYTIVETVEMNGVKAAAVLQRRPLAMVNWNGPKTLILRAIEVVAHRHAGPLGGLDESL